jgi:hypothetical protein
LIIRLKNGAFYIGNQSIMRHAARGIEAKPPKRQAKRSREGDVADSPTATAEGGRRLAQILNLLMAICSKPATPTKIFTDTATAEAWLQQFK